jgi:hypothetical protein
MSKLIDCARNLWRHVSIPSFFVGLYAGVFLMFAACQIREERMRARSAPPISIPGLPSNGVPGLPLNSRPDLRTNDL